MPPDSDDLTRCLRRYSNQNKSHLPKYSSLPELQLVMKETTLCCRQCGFTNSFININAWTCKEGQHEFASSVPRARRASAPPNVFIKIDLSPWKFTFLAGDHANIDFNRPEAPLKQTESSSIIDSPPILSSSSLTPHMQTLEATAMDLHQAHIDDIDTNAANDYRRRNPVTVIPESLGGVISDVATGTRSSLTHALQSTSEQTEYTPEQHNNAMGLKLSQGTFGVSPTEFHCDDTHELGKYPSLSYDHELTTPTIKPAHSKHQILRPLRRKNHLHVMPCPPAADASEPIAISLTLHHSSPPTSSHLVKKSSQRLTHSYTRAHSHLQSSVASISSSSGVTPPLTPTHQQRSSAPPKSNPESSPVRFGHPSRPYYTAIRKNGISPPTPSRSRPQSQPPPSSFHLGFDLTPVETTTMANSSRHLSMSAMLPIPPAFSALYDGNDDEVRDDNGNYEVHSGPTNSARLSLSSSHRLSYNNHTQTHALNAQSPAKVTKEIIGNNRSNGVGFSMSGETELRMALAASSVATTTFGRKTQGEFRFRETVIPSENLTNKNVDVQANTGSEYHDTRYVGSKDSFMGRVKKLRKGLKEMLMN